MGITKSYFGKTNDGRDVSLYTLCNKNGIEVKISDFGGTVVQLRTPDRDGRLTDIVCGFDSLEDYKNASGYQGALIGRVGNRIGKSKFTLLGKEYTLYNNDGANHLHGGKEGFSHKLWEATAFDSDEPELVLEYLSPDMEEGYPGNLKVKVTYKLTADDALSIHYEATTDKTTPVNMTNHTYFNLGGFASGSILSHTLFIDADTFLPTDRELIPTGEIKSVSGTPFDFREAKEIGRDINEDDEDIKNGGGYDICLNLVDRGNKEPILRAELYCKESGRNMQIFTNHPCIQFYTGNMMEGEHRFKGGFPQSKRNALALETQQMSDAVNHPNFTNVLLNPGEKYDYTTIYKFTVK